jgi:replicative DNA helicase
MEDNTRYRNAEAERSVLGAILLDGDALLRVEERLQPEDLAEPGHREIYAAMLAVGRRGEPVDRVLLAEELKRQGQLNTVGGHEYLGSLTESTITTAHLEQHTQLVAHHAAHRRQRETYARALQDLDRGADPSEVQRWVAAAELNAVRAHRAQRVGEMLHPVLQVFHERAEKKREPIATPWQTMNTALGGGLLPGVHFLIGGTGSGKTQWALQVALGGEPCSSGN